MILTSRPDDACLEQTPLITLVEDTSVDPPITMIEVDGHCVSIRRQDEGFTLLDFAKLLAALDLPFLYEELR